MSLGTIKDYTPNFNLIIPEFNISGWHDYLEENFRSIDALFYNLFGINNYNGIWKNLTSYTVGQVVFIGEDDNYSGRLVKVLVDHTTTNDDFSTFFENNPTYYELFADASTAQYYALQAKDWAIKTDGPVEGTSYSSKYYADIVNSLSTEITSLYNIINDLQTIASISTDIVNVADNETNINTVASNITAIQNAPTYATNAANSADLAKQYAIGDPSEPTGNSAKYWAEQASSELSTLEGDVSAIQANYLTTNTDQTITATKKFNTSPVRTSTIDPTTTTGEVEVRTLSTVTKNGSTVIASYNATRSGTNFSNRQRVNNPNLSNAWYDIRVNVDDAGQGYVNVACSSSITNQSNAYVTSSTGALYLPTMGWVNNPSTSTNVVHRSGTETITSTKTFAVEQKFNVAANITTNGLSIAPYTAGGADIGLRDTSNNWLCKLYFNYNGTLQLTGTSVTSITPTEDTTSSTQIDTVGARNTKLQNYISLTGTETITGDKSFTGTTTAVTQANSDSSTKVATTAYINNKFQVVSALPATPDPDTFYFIPES